jgi:hypothetical protein
MLQRIIEIAIDRDGSPIVPNASMVAREADGWWTAYSFRREGQGFAVLAHLLEKTPGTYLVFTDRDQMETLDPGGVALSLQEYVDAGKGWDVYADVNKGGVIVSAAKVEDAKSYKPTIPSTIGATNLVDLVTATTTTTAKTGIQIKADLSKLQKLITE